MLPIWYKGCQGGEGKVDTDKNGFLCWESGPPVLPYHDV